MAGSRRDPVSEAFDGPARRLLDKAYASPRQWVSVWLPDPSIRQRTRFLQEGINVGGPDPLPAGGGTDAKTRWARGFVRAVYYQHKNYSPRTGSSSWARRSAPRATGGLRVEVGRHVPASPQFDPAHPERGGFPPRRRVRIQLAAGGKAKDAAVTRLATKDRWAEGPKGSRRAGPRWADPAYRDWA
jgi:hypothetical protein